MISERMNYRLKVLIPIIVFAVFVIFHYTIPPILPGIGISWVLLSEGLFIVSKHTLLIGVAVTSGIGVLYLKRKKTYDSLSKGLLYNLLISLSASIALGLLAIIFYVIEHSSKYYVEGGWSGLGLVFLLVIILYFFLSNFLIMALVNLIWYYKLK